MVYLLCAWIFPIEIVGRRYLVYSLLLEVYTGGLKQWLHIPGRIISPTYIQIKHQTKEKMNPLTRRSFKWDQHIMFSKKQGVSGIMGPLTISWTDNGWWSYELVISLPNINYFVIIYRVCAEYVVTSNLPRPFFDEVLLILLVI